MTTVDIAARVSQSIAPKTRTLSPQQRERKIQRLIWTFEVEGIQVTREEAEEAIDKALSKPLPNI